MNPTSLTHHSVARRVRTSLTLVIALGSLAVSPAAWSQRKPRPNEIPAHLILVGDPASSRAYAEGWAPPPVERDGDGKIIKASIRCDVLEKEGAYAKDARIPRPPRKMLGRPVRDITGWLEGDPKLKPIVVSTPNAVLVVDLPRLKRSALKYVRKEEQAWLREYFPDLTERRIKKKGLTPVQRAVLYGIRYQRMEARFRDMMCLLEGAPDYRKARLKASFLGSRGRMELFVFPKRDSYREFGRHFFGVFGHYTSWWYNKHQDDMISAVHGFELNDAELASHFEYQVAHSLVYHYQGFHHHLPIWIPAGVGHHFQLLNTKVPPMFPELGFGKALTWGEAKARPKPNARPRWERAVRSLVSKGDDLPLARYALLVQFPDFSEKKKFKPAHHAQAWSMVNFALGLGKERWRRFIDEMKVKDKDESLVEVQYRAIERAYEIDQLTWQEAWKKWVLTGQRKRAGG